MTVRAAAHLTDDRLTEVCLDACPTSAEQRHLDGCHACGERRARLDALLRDMAAAAAAETDAVFTPQKLASQQARILQSILQDGRPGRVIAFPAASAPAARLFRSRPAARWVAAAAAAGLFIGLAVGRWAHMTQPNTAFGSTPARAVAAHFEPVSTLVPQVIATSEDELLGEIENAVTGPVSVLRSIHELTPLVDQVVGTTGEIR